MITRKIPSEGYKYSFPEMSYNHPRAFTQAAALTGVRPPNQGSGVDLVAGLTIRVEGTRDTLSEPMVWDDADPWTEVFTPSVDARFGVTPNIGVSATINPDFSEVEADVNPVVLNQRFAFSFPERRQFFTEGDGFFRDTEGTLYSRSIVRPVEGVKISGREGPWSLGLLHTIDQQPDPSFHELGTPGFDEDDVENRWGSNAVVRLRRDVLSTGTVGITLADKRLIRSPYAHDPSDTSPVNSGFDQLGLDATLPLGDRWFLTGSSHHSLVTGAELLYGTSNRAEVKRTSGTGAGLTFGVHDRTLDYRRELGFMPQSGLTNAWLNADYTVDGGGVLTQWIPSVSVSGTAERSGEAVFGASHRNRWVLGGVHTLEVVGGGGVRRESGEGELSDVPEWWTGITYRGQLGAALTVAPSVSGGQTMDFDTLEAAHHLGASVTMTLRVAGLRVDGLIRHNEFVPSNGVRERDNFARLKTHWQLTRTLGVRWIESLSLVNDDDPVLTTSLLATWQLHPFTSAHIGYGEEAVLGQPWGATARSVFAKVQVLIPQ